MMTMKILKWFSWQILATLQLTQPIKIVRTSFLAHPMTIRQTKTHRLPITDLLRRSKMPLKVSLAVF